MTGDDKFLTLVEQAFPMEPIPHRFFHEDFNASFHPDDIKEELSNRIEGRGWIEISILDWRMIGSSPDVCRHYLKPATFIYYLPSLLVGVVRDIAYVDFALEAIIPHNKFRIPRGEWWFEFQASISSDQRKALTEFLLRTRRVAWNDIGPMNQALLEHAERIWCEPGT